MYKQILQNISGIEIFPVISLIIFFTFFIAVIIWSFTRNKKYISKMENIPLETENENENMQKIYTGGVE
ncbi:MAG: hypothetical protein IT280_06240 [Ignavibacteria bacterium]|nr:hypothetical protein [Ignavibacteria bacterium]